MSDATGSVFDRLVPTITHDCAVDPERKGVIALATGPLHLASMLAKKEPLMLTRMSVTSNKHGKFDQQGSKEGSVAIHTFRQEEDQNSIDTCSSNVVRVFHARGAANASQQRGNRYPDVLRRVDAEVCLCPLSPSAVVGDMHIRNSESGRVVTSDSDVSRNMDSSKFALFIARVLALLEANPAATLRQIHAGLRIFPDELSTACLLEYMIRKRFIRRVSTAVSVKTYSPFDFDVFSTQTASSNQVVEEHYFIL